MAVRDTSMSCGMSRTMNVSGRAEARFCRWFWWASTESGEQPKEPWFMGV